MTILWISLFILFLLFAISLYAYLVAFHRGKRTDTKDYLLPAGKQYEPYYPFICKCADAMIKIPYEEVYITSFDGLKLFGRYYHVKDNAPIHIMMHGYKSNPYIDFCGGSRFVSDMGHNVLVPDQRAHGKSEGSTITFGIKERKDCLSWINYCNERFGKSTPIILWGLSMGAATVLMATDLDLPENIKGIIADCPYSSPKEIIMKVCRDMGLPPKLLYPFIRISSALFGGFNINECNAVNAIKNNHLPILLFHGDDDRFVPFEMSKRIYENCREHIDFRIIEKAGHGLCYMVKSDEYEKSIKDFVSRII